MEQTLVKKALIHKVSASKRALEITWENGSTSEFHYIWLRDNCPLVIAPSIKQREIHPMDIPLDIAPASVSLNAGNQVEITWKHDGHFSRFDAQWLKAYCYSSPPTKGWQPQLWDAELADTFPVYDYEEVFSDDAVLYQWLKNFKDYGYARLCNVPAQQKIVVEIAKKLSYIWNVGIDFGDFFEIKTSVDITGFLGYTNKKLLAHTDEAYFNPVPPVQILHCLENEVKGGESTLVDGLKVADTLRKTAPEKFKLLSSLPVHFRWKNEEYDFNSRLPLIRLNELGEIYEVYFSNHSIQPFHFPPDIMEAYYKAYRTYGKMLTSDQYQTRFRFKKGDLNMIDNQRVLHGRTAFSKNGIRHLQGCYLGRDSLYSRLEVLRRNQTFGA